MRFKIWAVPTHRHYQDFEYTEIRNFCLLNFQGKLWEVQENGK